MFQHFKNCNLNLNGNSFVISDAELNQSIGLDSPYKYDERVNDRFLPNKNYEGNLRISYYLTGSDPLKNYIYCQENHRLTGNICGITFNQGYLNSYNISCAPNSPVLVNANIQFFDKLQGSFVNTNPQNKQGTILNLYNVSINNLSDYTTNTLNFISQANFSYNAQIFPSYEFVDTGTPPTEAKRISIGERTMAAEFISDNVNMDLPLSGEKFGITFTFINPHNTGQNENFGCSGRINSKTLNIQAGNLHTHQIRVQQNHLNHFGNIGNVVIATGVGIFTIYSQDGYKAFASNDAQLKYINKIMVGDTLCPDYTYFDAFGSNGIIVTTPPSIVNDILTVYTTRGNLVWPNVLNFGYSGITITGASIWSGFPGSIVNITGTNFYHISDVYFGNQRSSFKTLSSGLIQAVVPYNGTTYPIQVISSRRNLTGTSNRLFFCRPEITSATPLTGVWKDSITIGGLNFSGITGVKFGNVNANSFTILSNTIISAQTPETGAGFPTGYIYIYGSGGSAKSYSKYNPHVPIYSFEPISGIWGAAVNIRTKVDTGYLFPLSGGYKIKFGNVDTVFYPSGGTGTFSITDYSTSRYSTGNRSTLMSMQSNLSFGAGSGALINGLYDNVTWLSAAQQILRKHIIFDFTGSVIIQEIKWYQDVTAIQGEGVTGSWRFFGSNDKTTWEAVSNIFRLGSSATTTVSDGVLSSNTTGYRYYALSGYATGLTTATPYTREIEFKISTITGEQNNKSGCLTGLIPSNAQDDYIFIYQPDGVSTYSPNSLKFNVISEPQIYSFAPSLIRRYQFFTPVLNGKNFKYFSQKPYYFALSGGSGNNVQFYTNIVSNSGGAADTMYIPAIIITGHTGIYTAIVQNQAGRAIFSGALQVLSGINQAKLGGGTVATSTSVKGNKFAKYANDGSLDTFAAVDCTATNYANYLQLTAKNLMDVSLVQVEMNNLPTYEGEIPHQSGKISLYEKNAANPIFSIQDYSSISGVAFPTVRSLTNPGEFGGYTGIKTVRIFTPSGGASVTHYMGISEVNIF